MALDVPIAAGEIRFRSLFENTPEIILYQNKAGIILDANPAFLSLVELPKERVIGRAYNDFLPPEVRPLFSEKLCEAATGRTVRFDMQTSQGASEVRHWDVVKLPLWEHGEVVGVHMIGRDITEKAKNQQEIFAQNQDLQQFTYIVSHNLRSPLANALGLVDLLNTEPPDSPYFAQTLAHLQLNLQQLDQVLRDMNTILTIRDKQHLDLPEPVPLADIVHQVVDSMADVVAEVGGAVEVRIPAEARVRANRAYLHSIFLNLLTNAIKYRAPERPLRVHISAAPEGATGQCITVADNGSGFDQERAGADVFRLYKRFHPEHPGRGLGLYLVKTHVESMGGRIAVHSRVNEGTRFSISLP